MPFAVVATLTESLTSNPLATPSTYCFVAACKLFVGSPSNVSLSDSVPPAKFNFKAKASNTAFCEGATSVVPLLIASATVADFARAVVKYKLEECSDMF